jgi:uncharacterized protein YbcI
MDEFSSTKTPDPPEPVIATLASGISRDQSTSTKAQQIARAASAFEHRLTGSTPKTVTVVLIEDTLVITLHGALSPAEKALARSSAGAAQLQEYHQQLFQSSLDSLREDIKRITGTEVREATMEIDTAGTAVKTFTTGTIVQVFLLAARVGTDTWTGPGISDPL